MVMNFDNYSTSFQSLMSPMYNVQANYNAMAGGYGNGYGAGLGMGGYYPGMGAGYMGMGMGGFMTPMNGVGIGQFNADYLIKNDDKNNNYYARPIAAHKKHDEVPTMLGILGTALGTAALLLALAKGKKVKMPGRGARPRTNTPVNPTPVNPTPVNPTPVNPTPVNPTPSNPQPQIKGYLPAATGAQVNQTPVNPVNPNPVTPNNSLPVPVQPNKVNLGPIENYIPKQQQTFNIPQPGVKGYLPAPGQQNFPVLAESNKVNLGPIENYLPKQQQTFNIPQQGVKGYLPAPEQTVKGLLPRYTSRQAEAIAKQQAAMNLPSSGTVYSMPTAQIGKVNNNLSDIRPDLMRQGEVVYTTHTPQTLKEGYSIGANAKGADKLQALLAQLS